MIYVGSRYERSDVSFTLDSRTGSTRPTVMRTAMPEPNYLRPSNVIKWRDGERIDALGKRLIGSCEKWWVILDANPEILDPMSLTGGMSVVLP